MPIEIKGKKLKAVTKKYRGKHKWLPFVDNMQKAILVFVDSIGGITCMREHVDEDDGEGGMMEEENGYLNDLLARGWKVVSVTPLPPNEELQKVQVTRCGVYDVVSASWFILEKDVEAVERALERRSRDSDSSTSDLAT